MAADPISATAVDLVFDQPSATDAHLVFGATYVAPRDDIRLSATLPLPTVTFKFLPPARAELLAALPGLTVRSLVLRPSVPLTEGASLPGVVFSGAVNYLSHTQRPTVGQSRPHWQVAGRSETGATQDQQDARAARDGWQSRWEEASGALQGVEHRLPAVLTPDRKSTCLNSSH